MSNYYDGEGKDLPEIVIIAVSFHSRVSLLSQEPADTFMMMMQRRNLKDYGDDDLTWVCLIILSFGYPNDMGILGTFGNLLVKPPAVSPSVEAPLNGENALLKVLFNSFLTLIHIFQGETDMAGLSVWLNSQSARKFYSTNFSLRPIFFKEKLKFGWPLSFVKLSKCLWPLAHPSAAFTLHAIPDVRSINALS